MEQRYEIDGMTFRNADEVVNAFGAADYRDDEWAEVLASGYDGIREGNVAAFPTLSDDDQDELATATLAYAEWRVAQSGK